MAYANHGDLSWSFPYQPGHSLIANVLFRYGGATVPYRPTLFYFNILLPEHFQGMQIMFTQVSVIGFTNSPETTITGRVGSVTYVLPVPKYTRYISLVLMDVTRLFTICELIVYGGEILLCIA